MMKHLHVGIVTISAGKCWTHKEFNKQGRMRSKSSIEDMGVWEKIPRSQMPSGMKTIGTRWVDVNKQDEENSLYRSRLVGQEIKRRGGFDEFFAAMPSLSALKMLLFHRSNSQNWNKKTFRFS